MKKNDLTDYENEAKELYSFINQPIYNLDKLKIPLAKEVVKRWCDDNRIVIRQDNILPITQSIITEVCMNTNPLSLINMIRTSYLSVYQFIEAVNNKQDHLIPSTFNSVRSGIQGLRAANEALNTFIILKIQEMENAAQ